jgi:protein-ribulosamine 3-kinase
MLTASFLRQFESALGRLMKKTIHIRRVTPVSGGSINLSARVDTTAGLFFLKANDAFKFPQMFDREASGLETLRSANCFTVPKVIHIGEEDGQAYLLLEFIDTRPRVADFWERFGKSLAVLHRITSDRYGFHENNFIGSLRQVNTQRPRWTDFFVSERLEPMVKMAMSKGLFNDSDISNFGKLFSRIDQLVPEEPASLLHGDLWNGNFMIGYSGEPVLIDPAVYYGHREMDLAMTRLFGGFDDQFYEAYNSEFPLTQGFEERMNLHNLYPLLVHLILFGGDYLAQIRSSLRKYV